MSDLEDEIRNMFDQGMEEELYPFLASSKLLSRATSTASEITFKISQCNIPWAQSPSGIRIIESPHAVIREQIRFPKSKKKRIRKKWAKRECNFRTVPMVYFIGDMAVVHSSIVVRLEDEMARGIDVVALKNLTL